MSVTGMKEVEANLTDTEPFWEGLTVLVHIPESVISEDSTRQRFKHLQGIPKLTDTSS